MSESSRIRYQRIYENLAWYGNARIGRSPGVRLLPEYVSWLEGPILDLGCGRGHTVERLRELGHEAEGVDHVDLGNGMRVGSITVPIVGLDRFRSAICIDVVEHLTDDELQGLFDNLVQVPRQVLTIHNGPAAGTGSELHVNRKRFEDWQRLLEERFELHEIRVLSEQQRLYLIMPRPNERSLCSPSAGTGSGSSRSA